VLLPQIVQGSLGFTVLYSDNKIFCYKVVIHGTKIQPLRRLSNFNLFKSIAQNKLQNIVVSSPDRNENPSCFSLKNKKIVMNSGK
jgi:hypothetical protein